MTDQERLYDAVAKTFNVDVDTLTPETHFYNDLHSRSVNMFMIAAVLEDITGKTVTYNMIHNYKTLGEMTEYMERRKAE